MSARSLASLGILASAIGIASAGYLGTQPTPPIPPVPPAPVVWSMQSGGGYGGNHKWLDEAHQKDLNIAAAKAWAEEKDEEAVVLAIVAEAVKQFYT